MGLGVETTEYGVVTVLTLRGEIDLASAPPLRQALVEAADRVGVVVVVDLDEVEFIDSTGLGVLIGGLKRARTSGGDLMLVCTQPRIIRLLEMTRLDRALEVHSTVAEAAAAAVAPK